MTHLRSTGTISRLLSSVFRLEGNQRDAVPLAIFFATLNTGLMSPVIVVIPAIMGASIPTWLLWVGMAAIWYGWFHVSRIFNNAAIIIGR